MSIGFFITICAIIVLGVLPLLFLLAGVVKCVFVKDNGRLRGVEPKESWLRKTWVWIDENLLTVGSDRDLFRSAGLDRAYIMTKGKITSATSILIADNNSEDNEVFRRWAATGASISYVHVPDGFHFIIFDNPKMLWLEGNHPAGREDAFNCEFAAPNRADEPRWYRLKEKFGELKQNDNQSHITPDAVHSSVSNDAR